MRTSALVHQPLYCESVLRTTAANNGYCTSCQYTWDAGKRLYLRMYTVSGHQRPIATRLKRFTGWVILQELLHQHMKYVYSRKMHACVRVCEEVNDNINLVLQK